METFFVYVWFSWLFMSSYMLLDTDEETKLREKLLIVLICLIVGWIMLPTKLAETIYKIDNKD